jgi:hypothetical protein
MPIVEIVFPQSVYLFHGTIPNNAGGGRNYFCNCRHPSPKLIKIVDSTLMYCNSTDWLLVQPLSQLTLFAVLNAHPPLLGCDFVAPIHKYTNTQKTVFLLCKDFLPSQPSFVYLFCQKGDFFGPIHGFAYKMTTFLFVYSFFICSTNRRPNIRLFLGYQQIHRR